MGFGFRKSIKIAPGVRLNVGKIKSSLSIGGKGLTTNVSKRGLKSTVSIPKTGLSYTTETASLSAKEKVSKKTTAKQSSAEPSFLEKSVGFLFVLGILYLLITWIF